MSGLRWSVTGELDGGAQLEVQCMTGARGGWVLESDHNDVLEACIFPDMSSIDSWGLAYHSEGIIRGKDLAKVLRYQNPYSAARRGHTSAKPLPF